MKALFSRIMISSALLLGLSPILFAQETVEYDYTDILLDEPDIIMGVQAGMFIPGLVGYELSGTLSDAFIRNTYFDFRYTSTVGMRTENRPDDVFMNSFTEYKFKAGFGRPQIVSMKHGATLSERTEMRGGKETKIFKVLETEVPTRSSLIYYGLAGLRDMPMVINGQTVDGKTTYIGGGARWQHYRNYGVDVKGHGRYRYQEIKALYAEAHTASKGPYQGIGIAIGSEVRGTWTSFSAEIGATVAGRDKGLDLLDTLTAKAVFGVFIDLLHSRPAIRYDSACWQAKRDLDCVK